MEPTGNKTMEGEMLPPIEAVPVGKSPVFDVRGFGWEGISVPVPNNVAQALEFGHLNWLVEKRPVTVDGKLVKGRVANVRTDIPQKDTDEYHPGVLEIVGSKYQIVQNFEAYAFVQDVLNTNTVRLERAGSFNGGKVVFLQASTRGITIGGEPIQPYLTFVNSHDGSGKVKVFITSIRIGCRNTLAVAIGTAPRVWAVQHTKSVTEQLKAAQASMNFIGRYLSAFPMFAERMIETPISDAQFAVIANTLFPIPEKTEKNVKAWETATENHANFEIIYDETHDLEPLRGTAWGVYNAYSDFVSHKTAKRTTENFLANRFFTNIKGANLENAQHVIMAAAGA